MTLAPHTPAAIHVINKRMYWYYEIDGWKFHSPIPEEQTSAELRKFAAHQIEPRELNDFTPLNVAISDAELLPLINRFGSMTIERINELREKWQEREERFATRHARNEYHNGEDDEI